MTIIYFCLKGVKKLGLDKKEDVPLEEHRKMDQVLKVGLEHLLKLVKNGTAVLTAGEIGIPTIHNIKDATHRGFGFFEAQTPNGTTINFDAGGMMRKLPKPVYGWTPLRGDAKGWGYNYEAVAKRLSEILEKGQF